MHRFSEAVSLHLISLDYLENNHDHEVLYAALIIRKKLSVDNESYQHSLANFNQTKQKFKKKGRRHL